MPTHSMDSHMNFRMSSKDKKTIEIAAMIQGLKPNTYARKKLLEIAEKEICEMNQLNTLVLNDQDWNRFIDVMEAPIKINKPLKKAIADFNRLTKQS